MNSIASMDRQSLVDNIIGVCKAAVVYGLPIAPSGFERRPRNFLRRRAISIPTCSLNWRFCSALRSISSKLLSRSSAFHFTLTTRFCLDEIAEALKRGKGAISKDCTGLASAGLIERSPPRVTKSGVAKLLDLWPDLYSVLAKQGVLPMEEDSI